MAFGILEPRLSSGETVPGTVRLFDQGLGIDQQLEFGHGIDIRSLSSRLKRDGDIILVPQPSDSPNDPLNWPTLKKDFVLFVLCLAVIMSSAASPLIASSSIVLLLNLGHDFRGVALLTGWHLAAGAITSLFVTAIAVKYGKRFIYLFALVFLIAGAAWGGAATSYRSLLGARILQGVGLAPFEVLMNTSIGDMYFVHQRGYRLAIANLCLFGTTFMTPLIGGHISRNMSWHWLFWFLLIFTCIAFILVFLFLPEHVYKRSVILDIDYEGEGMLMEAIAGEPSSGTSEISRIAGNEEGTEKPPQAIEEKPETWLHSLRLFSGSKSDRPLWKIFLRPFALVLHPGIWWAALIQAPLIAWTVIIGLILAAIFLGPPLWYNDADVGNMYTGALVGSIVGFIFSGTASDFIAKFLSKRNNNVYEPEYRILLVVAQLACGCAGIWGFGITSNNLYKYSKYLPPFFFGLESCGMIIGAVASASYVTDAYRHIQVEAMVFLVLVKNLVSFALTDRGYEWVRDTGIKHAFVVAGSIQAAISAFSLLNWFFGKYCRYYAHKYDILKILHLE
ncbi:major facilitator superfamily domain-containing protein [Lipomyces oligophaga]|uniref:major facilitator superfamily domain-containing protein n=1 Tax=Lipomyces oligophaga TaxID=45792 RepID=UPI0034CD75B7